MVATIGVIGRVARLGGRSIVDTIRWSRRLLARSISDQRLCESERVREKRANAADADADRRRILVYLNASVAPATDVDPLPG